MIASAQTLRKLMPVVPFVERTTDFGLTYGLSPAGYDIRIAERHEMRKGDFALGSSVERFYMPDNLLGVVHDKSSWARQGLAVQNTVIEPGWRGFLTLELTMHADKLLYIYPGQPIAQVVFYLLDAPTDRPYAGRYQDQREGPQPALFITNPAGKDHG